MKRCAGLVVLSMLPLISSAQLDLRSLKSPSEEALRQQKERGESFLNEREEKWNSFMTVRKEEWAKVISTRDLDWTGLLNDSEWTVFDDFLYNEQPVKPKPTVAPQADKTPPTNPNNQPISVPDVEPVAVPDKTPTTPPKIKPELLPEANNSHVRPDNDSESAQEAKTLPCKPAEPIDNRAALDMTFYGCSMRIVYAPQIRNIVVKKDYSNKKNITEFWSTLSETNYTPTIENLLVEKNKIGLNDWGFYLLARAFSENLFHNDWDRSILMTWFILVRSGYDARVGITTNGVALLLPCVEELYMVSYINVSGYNYYIIENGKSESIQTYEYAYADGALFSFQQRRQLLLGDGKAIRTLSFNFRGTKYTFKFEYNSNIISYYKNLPQAQNEVFFNALPSSLLRQSIEDNLRPIVKNMDRQTATNFLLQFVQLAFEYKTDEEQFGYEKYFYNDELFAYPYCDCEDRSVLFSYLAHTLLGYETIGTEFPDHMATAVALDYSVNGTKYNISGKTFTIADPTYLNAEVGQCMPQYKGVTPKVHIVDIAE